MKRFKNYLRVRRLHRLLDTYTSTVGPITFNSDNSTSGRWINVRGGGIS